ncbi:hypothetical protein TNIN_495501 [Trichonephila inaurata madagascariensis]|uniref:Uncharacterized protein n=1 Tax=Trichonephila inaurata madagascariensis TaxID=2747483 RepID=A0A8X6X6W5_9ARAC|nr:hypothetical protein TNIN_495501 [Trichonephila inaurata madagascariensis]
MISPTAFMIRNLVGRFEDLDSVADILEEVPIEIFVLKTIWKLCGRVLQMIHLSQFIVVPANRAFSERHRVEF